MSRTVTVSRYVLPKYKVTLSADRGWYLPGQTISGTVEARYFFGKPCNGAHVHLQALPGSGLGEKPLAQVTGDADADGCFHYHITLPDTLYGSAQHGGNAVVTLNATVTDKAGHVQETSHDYPVSREGILLSVLPEAGTPVAGVENQFYVITSYPDGSPAPATVQLLAPLTTTVHTDANGITSFCYTPASGKALIVRAHAQDNQGVWGDAKIDVASPTQLPTVLIRTDKPLYHAGDIAKILVLAPGHHGTCYLEVSREKQPVATRVGMITDGKAALELPISHDLAGVLMLQAFLPAAGETLSATELAAQGSRGILVQAADELHIDIEGLKDVRPGEEQQAHIHVTDPHGHGVATAVSLSGVDESVYALEEQFPGISRIFAQLQQELQDPTIEIRNSALPARCQLEHSQPADDTAGRVALAAYSAHASLWVHQSHESLAELDRLQQEGIAWRHQFALQLLCALFLLLLLITYCANIAARVRLAGTDARRFTIAQTIILLIGISVSLAALCCYDAAPLVGAALACLHWCILLGCRRGLLNFSRFRPVDAVVWLLLAEIVGFTSFPVCSLAWRQTRKVVNSLPLESLFRTNVPVVATLSSTSDNSEQATPAQSAPNLVFNTPAAVSWEPETAHTAPRRSHRKASGSTATTHPSATHTATPTVTPRPAATVYYLATPTGASGSAITLYPLATPTAAASGSAMTLYPLAAPTAASGSATTLYTLAAPTGASGSATTLYSLAAHSRASGAATILYTRGASSAASGTVISLLPAKVYNNGYSGTIYVGSQDASIYAVNGIGGYANYGFISSSDASGSLSAITTLSAAPVTLSLAANQPLTWNLANDTLNVTVAPQQPVQMIHLPSAVRVREYFPETLTWQPEIITDRQGRAEVTLPAADAVTTWRLSLLANAKDGRLGSADIPYRVFQDFFVDVDAPAKLTVGDKLSLPVAVHNYAKTAQTVKFTLDANCGLAPDGVDTVSVTVAPGEVGVGHFPVRALAAGHGQITVKAVGASFADSVRRHLEVIPAGERTEKTRCAVLRGNARLSVSLPPGVDASDLSLRFYPGPLSQVLGGLDGLLQRPYGCFEQTTSTTYPNVMVLHYLRESKSHDIQAMATAETYVSLGYQRLLTFEVRGGGFSLWGNAPADFGLTALGLAEFEDISQVQQIDPNLLQRTADWLAAHWGSATPLQRSFALYQLTRTEHKELAADWIIARGSRMHALSNFELALLSNAAECTHHPLAPALVAELAAHAQRDISGRHWDCNMPASLGNVDEWMGSSAVEVTALALQALAKADNHAQLVRDAMDYLMAARSPDGGWSDTQATVQALRTILGVNFMAANGTVQLWVNGYKLDDVTLNGDGTVKSLDLHPYLRKGENTVVLHAANGVTPACQLVAGYYAPWQYKTSRARNPISVSYDKTTLHTNDVVTATVRVTPSHPIKMAMIDLAVPPGFSPFLEDLDALKRYGAIARYDDTGVQLILYLRRLSTHPVTFHYRLRALYPVSATVRPSCVYPYYHPQQVERSQPGRLSVGVS